METYHPGEEDMTIIVGLDVSNSFVFACPLTAAVDNPRQWFQKNRSTIERYDADAEGVARLLALQPEYAVLEPTGIHYSKLWADQLAGQGCKLLWVGHSQLKSYRLTLRLPNKNDAADAFALANYAHQYLGQPGYFLNFNVHSLGYHIRQLGLQLQYLESLTTEIKNRLRQQLAHEFPEVCQINTNGALWRFLAERPIHKGTYSKYSKMLKASVGSGISSFTRFLATELCNIEDQISSIEDEMRTIYCHADFADYQRVFTSYGMGDRVASMLLAHIYPLENFLGPHGQEIVEIVRSQNGKPSKRYRSLNSFKLMLGAGLVEDSSGKSERWIAGGSSLCRVALWQWLFTRIEVKKNRPKTAQGQKLGQMLDNLKAGGTPVKLARSRVMCKAAEMLFYDLLESLYP